VSTPTFEQSMGRGGIAEFEVPLPLDESALDCPDLSSKNEWDAIHPFVDLVQKKPLGDQEAIKVQDRELLASVRPQSRGGLTDEMYADALEKNPQPMKEGMPQAAINANDLDPTQRVVYDIGMAWAQKWMSEPHYKDQHPPQTTESLHLLLLGTAGTGKTTTLKALLQGWRSIGFGETIVAAFTGVAASNVGMGARTLHDLFKLSKTNPTSGELLPLAGEDLDSFKELLHNTRVLVIDEVSMVSRQVLAHVNTRLQEWRREAGLPGADLPFGGIGVILAGDFGQLPPVKVAPTFTLLNPSTVHGARESFTLNLGLRLFRSFETVVRLRRIHRQVGASAYKESLIRTRDGAMKPWMALFTYALAMVQ